MVGRRVLRIVGAAKSVQSIGSFAKFKEQESTIPVPRTLRDGRWRLIMSVVAALVSVALGSLVTSKAIKNLELFATARRSGRQGC